MVNSIKNLEMLSAMISLLYILDKNLYGEQKNQLFLMELKILYGPLNRNISRVIHYYCMLSHKRETIYQCILYESKLKLPKTYVNA